MNDSTFDKLTSQESESDAADADADADLGVYATVQTPAQSF